MQDAIAVTETWALRYPPVRDHTDGPTLTHTVHGIQGHPQYAVPWGTPVVGAYRPPADVHFALTELANRNQKVQDAAIAVIRESASEVRGVGWPVTTKTAPVVPAIPVRVVGGNRGEGVVYGVSLGLLLAIVFMAIHRWLISLMRPRRRRVAAWPRTPRMGPASSDHRRPAA